MFNYKMVFMLMLINTWQVNATVFTGEVTGGFSEGNTFIEWGTKKNLFTGSKSSLSYESINSFSTDVSVPFKVGTLTYNNTAITQSTSYAVEVADKSFDIGVVLTSPSMSSYFFNYDISILETDNNGPDSDDKLTLNPADGLAPTFVLNGQDYVFELLGFDNGSGGFDNSFVQAEDSDSPVDIYARISAVPVPSAIWLFMTALTGFFITSNRKRS